MSANNKTALVTGGSRGLGRNMALALAKKGIDVVITYNSDEASAAAVVSEIESIGQKAKAFQLDTRNIHTFDSFVKKVTEYLQQQNGNPNFDFLINNAGTALYAPAMETTEAQLDDIFNIHYKGVLFLTQHALPFLNEGGGVVNLSSGLARMTIPGSSVYASMKSAIETLTRYLAKELGPRKIRVNAVAPGAIETDFGGGHVRDNKVINAEIAKFTALGRVGLPDDIGSVVAFLCTEDARWITAQRIEVSGGQNL